MEEIIERLQIKYEAYEKERDEEGGIVDISVTCELADSIPYLLEQAKKLVWLKQALLVCNEEDLSPIDLAHLLSKYHI